MPYWVLADPGIQQSIAKTVKIAKLKNSAHGLVEGVFRRFEFERNIDLYKSKLKYDAIANVSMLTLIDGKCGEWLDLALSAEDKAYLNRSVQKAILLADDDAYFVNQYKLCIKPILGNTALRGYGIDFRVSPLSIRNVTVTYDEVADISDVNLLLKFCELDMDTDA